MWGWGSSTLASDRRQASCHSGMGWCLQAGSGSSALLWTVRWLVAWARSASHPAEASHGKVGGTGRFMSGLRGDHPIHAPSPPPEGDLAGPEKGPTGKGEEGFGGGEPLA